MKTPFFIILIFCSSFALGQTQNSTFLIPKNYKGLIYIFMNCPNADTVPVINNEQVFQIPNDGILLTKSISFDYSIQSFYYMDTLGNKQEISINCDDRPESACTTKVKIGGGRYEYHRSTKDKIPLKFLLISVTDNETKQLVKSKSYNLKMSAKVSKKLKQEFHFKY